MIDEIPGRVRAQRRPRKETIVKPKVILGSTAGVAVLLIGIGGA